MKKLIAKAAIIVLVVLTGCSQNNTDTKKLEDQISALQETVSKLQKSEPSANESSTSAPPEATPFAESAAPSNNNQSETAASEASPSEDAISQENTELKQKMNELQDQLNQVQDKASAAENDAAKAKDELEAQLQKTDRSNEEGTYLDTQDLLFWLVVRFDHAWIRYINAGDDEIFSYIQNGSQIYNTAVNYKKDHPRLKERILRIYDNDTTISGNQADIFVYERVEETNTDSSVTMQEYNWKYSAVKENGIWYLTVMTQNY